LEQWWFLTSVVRVGDEADSSDPAAWQGFFTFELAGIPYNANIETARIDFRTYSITGAPFAELGCFRAYEDHYGALDYDDYYYGDPSGEYLVACDYGDLSHGTNYLNTAGVTAIQGLLDGRPNISPPPPGPFLPLRIQFDIGYSPNGSADYLNVSPTLHLVYTVP
jgi:hypothetical protein